MQGVTHIVIGLSPLVDHDDLRFIQVQTIVVSRIEVQGASRMIGNGHTRLTDIGVRSVNVDLAIACAFDKYILDRGLTNSGFASKVY